jgi:serine/threonine protein phosphatase PrpC
VTAVECLSCDDERAAGATFCEACGRRLVTCVHCGGGVADDGYCESCGMLAERPRDHLEIDLGMAGAAVTDRGLRHHRNEDAVFLAARGADVDVVVCDGVSSSSRPDEASATAASTAGSLLADLDPRSAVERAAEEVAALGSSGDAPACTIVAATLRGTAVGFAWIGDSRAYFVPPEGPAEQLTEDDSWARHVVAMGADPAAAMLDPKAHAITAWLGADAGAVHPHSGSFDAAAPGHLVLCSDGLWNYLTDPAELAEAVRDALTGFNCIAAARSLTDLAKDRGGADNITVALIPVGGPRGVHR